MRASRQGARRDVGGGALSPAAGRATVRVVAVSDEVDEALWSDTSALDGASVLLSCGDLPFDYLRRLTDALEVPLVLVPGNHDPDLGGYRTTRHGLVIKAGLPAEPPWPPGAVNADRRVVDVAGLRIAGLGGSPRYSEGPNQWTERQFAARARRVALAARWRALRDHRRVDVLLTHTPPRGVGDADDPPHRGFVTLHRLVDRLRPGIVLHGHVHPYGASVVDQRIGEVVVRNVVGCHVFDVEVGHGA
jgi:calcineurin-like phosphoesterase family protein